MKAILLTALIFSLPSLAAESKQVINTTASISVNSLRCVIDTGRGDIPLEERTFTRLGGPGINKLTIFEDGQNNFELEHTQAEAQGCDMEKLDKIAEAMQNSFGFIAHAPLEITSHLSASRINGVGHCIALYKETLKMDLGLGVELISVSAEFRPATDCN